MSSAELLAAWSRRFLTQLHHDLSMHRPGLLIGADDEVRFWPFPELDSIDALATFLAAELPKAQELQPEAVALVLPMATSDLGGFEVERDYEVMVVAVDAYRHCSTLMGAVAGGETSGWRDLTAATGYLPKLAPLLFHAFTELQPPRPDDDTEWALVEASTHTNTALEDLVIACAVDLARRRGGAAERELAGALSARPSGAEWESIAAESGRLTHIYQGYVQELTPPFSSLADLEEPAVAQLFFASLVELLRRDSLSQERIESRLGAQLDGK